MADATLQATVEALTRSEMATRELSHRVMNTFHALEGVLAVKIRSMSDTEAKAATAEALERIRGMSLVHQKLFALTQNSEVNLDASSFLDSLVRDLSRACASDKKLELHIAREEGIHLSAERCTSLGLLAVELVLNALKHGFDDDQSGGMIDVALRRDADFLVFSVRDNGKGLPEGSLVGSKKSLGTKLVQSFVADLKADLKTRNLPRGVEFLVRIPAFT